MDIPLLSIVHSFFHSLNKLILSIYYMPGPVLGTGGTGYTKPIDVPVLLEFSCKLEGKKINKKYRENPESDIC